MSAPLDVPERVRQRALSNGVAGRQWLDDLPDVVAGLTSRWNLELGRPFSGGTASYVVAVDDSSGRACVLKVAMPLDLHDEDAFRLTLIAHQLSRGRGCAEMLRHSESPPAMLLERLGPNLSQLEMPLPRLLEAIVATLQSFWTTIPADVQLPTARDQAAWLAAYIESTWDDLGRPCERAVVDRALDFCARRVRCTESDRARPTRRCRPMECPG
jgi:streptomycin 6-kinase